MLSRERFRYRLYRLQQRLAITRREALAMWIVLALIVLGAAIKEYRERTLRFDPAIYAESDSLFAAATEALLREEASVDTAVAEISSGAAPAPSDRININTASRQELERLPRIGPAMAERIVAYRERYGPFRRPQDLMRVRGIGPKTYEQLAPMIVIR